MAIRSTNELYLRLEYFYDRLRRLRNDAFDFGVVDEVLNDLDTSLYCLHSTLAGYYFGGSCDGKKEDETEEG